jgi:hypothetical protein
MKALENEVGKRAAKALISIHDLLADIACSVRRIVRGRTASPHHTANFLSQVGLPEEVGKEMDLGSDESDGDSDEESQERRGNHVDELPATMTGSAKGTPSLVPMVFELEH